MVRIKTFKIAKAAAPQPETTENLHSSVSDDEYIDFVSRLNQGIIDQRVDAFEKSIENMDKNALLEKAKQVEEALFHVDNSIEVQKFQRESTVSNPVLDKTVLARIILQKELSLLEQKYAVI